MLLILAQRLTGLRWGAPAYCGEEWVSVLGIELGALGMLVVQPSVTELHPNSFLVDLFPPLLSPGC